MLARKILGNFGNHISYACISHACKVKSPSWQLQRKRRLLAMERNLPKKIPYFSRKSEQWAASPRSRGMATTTSFRPPFSATSPPTAPEALHQPNPPTIRLQDLATRLGVEPAKLLPTIKAGYLTLACADPPVVYEPPAAAIEWLRSMFQPLILRPFLPIQMVAELESITASDVRLLALTYDIPVQIDEVFGELLTPISFFKLHESLHHYREPSRFDRQAMIVALLNSVDPERYKHVLKPPPYSKRLEKEIRRIAALGEPLKTEMALRLVEAMEDCTGIVDIIARLRGKDPVRMKAMARAERMVAVDMAGPSEDGCEVG